MKTLHLIISGFFILLLLFFGSSNNLKAQTELPKNYNLSDCIELAIQNSYQLQSDSLLSKSLQMALNQEQASYYPEISGSAGISGLFLSPYTFGQHYLQAVADWDLGKFWHKTAEIQQKRVEQQEVLIEQNKLEITSVITGLYLDVLQNQLEQQILQSKYDYLDKHIQILTVLWKAGTVKQLDILQTQSSINTVKEEMMQKELAAKQIRYAMARLMGLDSPENLTLTKLDINMPGPEVVPEIPDTWLYMHPLSIRFQKKYETELLMKKNILSSFSPHIQAFSGYTFDGDPAGDGNYVLLGLGATVPIYSWKKKDYQLNEIDFTAESIQKEKQNIERDLSIQLGQITQQIEQYKRIIDFQQEKINTDRELTTLAEINYKVGLATNLDFLLAQQMLTETELKINTVRNQYIKSVVAMWLLTGQIDKIKNIN